MSSISIVLANQMDATGKINAETAARIEKADQMSREQKSSLILLCGWHYRHETRITIADAMKQHIVSRYPELTHICRCQRLSRDTVGDAVFSRIYIGCLNCDLTNTTIKVVTSDYHVARAKEIFRFVFGVTAAISVVGVPGFGSDDSGEKEAASLSAFRATFRNAIRGDMTTIYSSLRDGHPFYNGTIHPKVGSLKDIARILMKNDG